MTLREATRDELLEENAALRAKLEQMQRMAVLGELTSTTTHEFNNLLTTMLNYAKLGLRYRDEPSRDKAFQRILDASNRAAKLTGTILAMARNRTGQMEPTDLKQVIEDTLLLMEKELQKYRIGIEKKIESVPLILATGSQLQRVLINMLVNARQAMPNGGMVLLQLTSEDEGRIVTLAIRDTGQGIAPEHLPKIFDPFFSTKSGPDASGKGGTGLGLSACREIIESHSGRIRVESTIGRGTQFIMRFPSLLVDHEAA
ncbi:MAG: sensor histidine kinase [Planctomycetaceae bacterium]|nr:sensor histidine kinase [Planctomycetaceae bacterium]MBN8601362.1 sensor histidine kinase [Planctomycetota bacterium]